VAFFTTRQFIEQVLDEATKLAGDRRSECGHFRVGILTQPIGTRSSARTSSRSKYSTSMMSGFSPRFAARLPNRLVHLLRECVDRVLHIQTSILVLANRSAAVIRDAWLAGGIELSRGGWRTPRT